ncbi:MAG: hypothetical protein WC655_24545 [Candidatus Hydrogenedentales bacterium]
MADRERSEFLRPEAGDAGKTIDESAVRRGCGKQRADLCCRQGAPPHLWRRVKSPETLERIFGEILALDTPITEGREGFRIISQRLLALAVFFQHAQGFLYPRKTSH